MTFASVNQDDAVEDALKSGLLCLRRILALHAVALSFIPLSTTLPVYPMRPYLVLDQCLPPPS